MAERKKAMSNKYATSIEIERIVNNWIDASPKEDNKYKTGISMLPAQTGSGKSYSVAKIMNERTVSSDFQHAMIYMVHTKENLKQQYADFIKHSEDARSKALLLKEDAEMITDFFKENDIESFNSYPEYRALKKVAENANTLKENNQGNSLDYLELFREKINIEANKLKMKLRKEHKSLSGSKKDALKENTAKIFPTVNLHKYKAVFLTTNKFMLPIWTLSGNTFIYEIEEFQGAKLFIDEFDAQKNIMLSKFIDDATNTIIDKISFFTNVRHVLKEGIFLEKYGIEKDTVESTVKQLDTIYKKYIDTFSFVYRSKDEAIRYILRSEAVSSFDSSKTPLTINRDEVHTINWVEEDPNKKDYQFVNMVKEIDSAIKRISGIGFKVISKAKEKAYNDKQASGASEWIDYVHIANTVTRQFIGEFNLNSKDESFKYFEKLILHRSETKKENPLSSIQEDFYNNGLSLIQMEDAGEDAKRTSFNFYTLLHTPEYFIAKKISSRMHIIAISATVNIDSVIRNFDLNYLRSNTYTETLSQEEVILLDQLYLEGKSQKNRPFHIDFIDFNDTQINDTCHSYFNDNPKANTYLKRFFQGKKDYMSEKYRKMIHLYWNFVSNTEIKSFLVLLNGYPKVYWDNNLDEPLLRKELLNLFSLMLHANYKTGKLKPEFDNYITRQNERNELLEQSDLFFIYDSTPESNTKYLRDIKNIRLKKRGSAFVISTYQAMGAGRNIHYTIENDNHPYEKDYDAIYCEKPTHLLVRGADEKSPISSLLKLLYQLHALHASGSISKDEFKKYLGHAMTFNDISWKAIAYNKGEDYTNTIMMIVIQAIGRLHRANNPDDPMYIFLDEGLYSAFESFDIRGHTLLPSVSKVLELARNDRDKTIDIDASDFTKEVVNKSAHMRGKISKLLKSFKNPKMVERWKEYESYLLSNPTVSNLEHIHSGLFTPALPKKKRRYWYKEYDDYKNLEVRLVGGGDFIEVSAAAARLPILQKVPELIEWIKEKEIDTEWKHSHFMTPIVFNNLYKGRLGESVGRWIFEKHYGINLNGLPEEEGFYEFFDFVSDNGIYVDFKYYSKYRIETTSEREVRDKAAKKLNAIGAKMTVIINLFYMGGLNNVSREISEEDGVVIVPFIIDASDVNNPKLDQEMLKKLKDIFL